MCCWFPSFELPSVEKGVFGLYYPASLVFLAEPRMSMDSMTKRSTTKHMDGAVLGEWVIWLMPWAWTGPAAAQGAYASIFTM